MGVHTVSRQRSVPGPKTVAGMVSTAIALLVACVVAVFGTPAAVHGPVRRMWAGFRFGGRSVFARVDRSRSGG